MPENYRTTIGINVMTVIVTKQMLRAAKTIKGGYSNQQVSMARDLTIDGKKPIAALEGKTVSDEWWGKFSAIREKQEARQQKTKERKQKKLDKKLASKTIINPMPKDTGSWEWKPQQQDVPRLKVVSSINGKNQQRRQSKRDRISRTPDKEFYISPEWRAIRVRVLSKYDCKCMMCGRSPKMHGIVIHVDHIKPRSKYPDLALCFDNLQLLCEDCNIGKSNKYEDDYRPEIMPDSDWDSLENMPITMQ